MSQPAEQEQPTYYERVGGHETFVKLVHEFYRGVARDEALRELADPDDRAAVQRVMDEWADVGSW